MGRFTGRAFTICLALVAFCAVDVYSQECGNVQGPEHARIQGSPGKRGEPGIVDYDKVAKMIEEQLSRALANMSSLFQKKNEGKLEELERKMKKIEKTARGGCEVYYDNMCFFSVVDSTRYINFDEAESICEERGANVANIYSKRHYDLIMGNLRAKIPDGWSGLNAWTGLRRNPMDGSVTLRNGNPAPFTLWRRRFPQTGSSYSTWSHIYLLVYDDPGASDQGMGNQHRSYGLSEVVCQD